MFTRFAFAALLSLTSVQSFAGPYDRFECSFNDVTEAKDVRFSLTGQYTVHGTSHATLAYDASIEFLTVDYTFSNTEGGNFVFSHAKALRGEAYHGRKYQDHFKFPIEWHGVNTDIDRGVLILSRLPSKTIVEGRRTTKTFTGVLDVSYNDHHGDYVWVKCTERTFAN